MPSKTLFAVRTDGVVQIYEKEPELETRTEEVFVSLWDANGDYAPRYRKKTVKRWPDNHVNDMCERGFRSATGITLEKDKVTKIRVSVVGRRKSR